MTRHQVKQLYTNAIRFIETPIQELADEHYMSYITNKGTPRKRKGYVPGKANI